MTRKNLLFVSIAFPPKRDPECIQTARYFIYLSRLVSDFNIDVVTSRSPTLYMPDDNSLASYDQGYRQIIKLKIAENRYLNALLNRTIPVTNQLPDSKFSFFWQWQQVTKKLNKKPDIIYSRSYPLSSALMALNLKQYYKVPWIMHLSDPWADSPLHDYKSYARKKNERWEKTCFTTADKICLTSAETISFYSGKYPQLKHKFVLCPNVYDPEDIAGHTPGLNKKLTFVYTGGLANTRSIVPLLEALTEVCTENHELLNNCEFIIAGEADAKNRAAIKNHTGKEITYLGPVSAAKARDLQSQADVLIAIDSYVAEAKKSVFFPSKLLDYLVAGKRIWAITTPDSATYKFIIKHQLGSVSYVDKPKTIASELINWLKAYRDKNKKCFVTNSLITEYDAKENAQKLLHFFDQLA